MKRIIYFVVFILTLFHHTHLGARYSNGGVELVKFMTLQNTYCTTQIYQEYNKFDEFNKYLKISFMVFPDFIQEKVNLTIKEEEFHSRQRELEIHIISDKTLNSRITGRYGLLLPVNGLYDSAIKTIYISKDYDIKTLVHEYFHFLRDISGIALKQAFEEELADVFADHIVDSMDIDGLVCKDLTSQAQ
jgi:hypothetical protein